MTEDSAALAGRLQALDGREIFRRLEIALYGQAGNTWSLPRYERVMAVCNELAAALQEAVPSERLRAALQEAPHANPAEAFEMHMDLFADGIDSLQSYETQEIETMPGLNGHEDWLKLDDVRGLFRQWRAQPDAEVGEAPRVMRIVKATPRPFHDPDPVSAHRPRAVGEAPHAHPETTKEA